MDLKPFLLLLILICVAGAGHFSKSSSKGQYLASVFLDLTMEEMTSVQSFLMAQEELHLVSIRHNMGKNSIFMMELNLPKKQKVQKFLDKNGPKPKRKAKVVIFFGDQAKANITEYIVGPLPHPQYYRQLTRNKPLRFESRPVTIFEYEIFISRLKELTKEFTHILLETSGFSFYNCSSHCLSFTDAAPRGLNSGERRSWLMIKKLTEAYILQAIGLELLLNHRSLNPKEWTIDKVWYNGQYFHSVKEFVQKYDKNELTKLRLPDDTDYLFSTFIPRGEFKTKTNMHGPKICEPQEKRYRILGNYVEYTGWSFAYRVRPSAGLQIFDIQYNNERIAYEVSIQEAISFYSGVTPGGMQAQYVDSGWGMGTRHYELAKGIDCPEGATYQDLNSFYDTDKPLRFKNALCIFELPTGSPLRRHYDATDNGGYNFYAGLENQVLVVRTTTTVYNYDYIWDFLFYQNGVIEVKVSATGYIQATFFTPDGLRYGNRVHTHVLGNLHTHLVNYKVDLDIAGTENSFETIDLKYENITNPWSPGHFIVQSRKDHILRSTERQAAFKFGSQVPRYLAFQNPNKKNKWGHEKSYRIQYNSNGYSVLPQMWAEEKGIAWSRYSLAVTKQKDSEVTSSSIYIQNDPWDPDIYFENFVSNNEDIVNKDLVAWVTVGFLHIPQAEDIPNTPTPGNAVGFFLRPYNFFDEDPSVASRGPIIVRPTDKSFTKVNIQRWTPVVSGQCGSEKPFRYNGTYFSD
ncbi:diamine oxidase [copper-containing]-like [Dendropsophus ebraccatus]|uniref:diamine oxidase [copper-containing]-like n=1 Tax=Dendropsophus ebraccatus TaxID=150705 RepID=UPI0038312030